MYLAENKLSILKIFKMASLNKQALLRYRVINEQIRRQSYPSMEELIEACESKIGVRFSTETIQKDIRAMKNDEALGYEAPIHFNRFHRGYEYLIKDYSLDKVNLSDDEYDVLEDIVDILKQFRGTSLSANYANAVNKISTSILSSKQNLKNPIISMEHSTELTAINDLDMYIKMIKEHIPISITDTSNEGIFNDIIHPYMLKEHRNRWYVIAFSEEDKIIKPYRIAFIANIQKLTNHKFLFSDFNAYSYFKDSIGVSIHKSTTKFQIRIKFNKSLFDELQLNPIHQSQEIIKHYKNGNFIIGINIAITHDFINELLSFGYKATVLKPKWLIALIRTTIRGMASNYKI